MKKYILLLALAGIVSAGIVSSNQANNVTTEVVTASAELPDQDPEESTVLICVSPYAKKYHAYQCWGLKKCTHDIAEVSHDEAVRRGYTYCKICYK